MNGNKGAGGDVITVPCTVDILQGVEFIHAHVDLEGYEPRAGDEILVQGAAEKLAAGETGVYQCRAIVRRAGPLGRFMAHVEGYLELTELYEVGFSAGRAS